MKQIKIKLEQKDDEELAQEVRKEPPSSPLSFYSSFFSSPSVSSLFSLVLSPGVSFSWIEEWNL